MAVGAITITLLAVVGAAVGTAAPSVFTFNTPTGSGMMVLIGAAGPLSAMSNSRIATVEFQANAGKK